MSDRIGWGILGCGAIATHAIAPAIAWSGNGRLVAVASRDPRVAAEKRVALGAARAYAPYEALLEDREIDAVYVGLPNGLHETWALRAASAGKHVLCEKSLTLGLASARRVAEAFATRGLRLVEAFMYRHHPQWRVVEELLGAVGQVRGVRASMMGRLARDDDHRWSASLGGGALYDVTCYAIDAARFVLRGEPVAASALARLDARERVDAATVASLVFPGGVLAAASGALDSGSDQSLAIVGTEGTLDVAAPFVPGWGPTSITLRRGGEERRIEVGGANHYLHQMEHFASLVLDRARDPWPAEDGVGNAAACDAIARSFADDARLTAVR